MGVMNAIRILVRLLAKYEIKMSVKEIGCKNVCWIYRLRVSSDNGIL